MTKLSSFFDCFSLLLCLLAGFSIADPSAIDDMELLELQKRQDSNSTSVTSVSSPSTTTSLTASRTTTLRTTSQTFSTIPTTSMTPLTSSSTSPVLSTETSTTSSTSTPQQTPTTSNPISQTTTTTDEPIETVTPTTHVVIATHFTTVTSNGAAFTSAYVTSSTTVETPTGTANKASDASGGGGSSGIIPTTRNTIIGVVVGVGGALLFGGLAIVAWRLKRKNKNPVDEDDLMRRDGSPLAPGIEIHPASPEQSPFKTTLDQYHKPPGVVNTSSNF